MARAGSPASIDSSNWRRRSSPLRAQRWSRGRARGSASGVLARPSLPRMVRAFDRVRARRGPPRSRRTQGLRRELRRLEAAQHGRSPSPLRQLQLDAAIAGEGFLVGSVVDRLKLTEAGGCEEVWIDAPGDEILHNLDGPCGGKLPIRLERPRVDRSRVGVAVDAQDPGNVWRNFALEVEHGGSETIQRLTPRAAEIRFAGFEQDGRFEHEAVADDAYVGPRAQDLPQTAEEIGAVAR